MILDNLVTEITPIQIIGDKDKDITNIAIDSRLVKNSGLFIAVKGSETDGHLYIDRAIEGGATAVICEQLPKDLKNGITYIQLDDTHTALGIIADSFYNHPSKCLKLVGVTGTNGKTTIATLLYQLFKKLGYKAGLISTVCNYINDNAIAATHTTPDAITLNKLLREMVDAGCDYAFMEVSSHAIDQKRINGVNFVGGIFTNLTRDHLDYHGSVENYLKAKKAFFDNLPKEAFSLTNIDDRNGLVMTQNSASKKCTYSLKKLADFKGKILESHFEGMLLDFNSHELAVQFIGDFNAANLLAVYGAAKLLGEDEKEILIAISALKPVSGRFESLKSPKGYTAIVDYAHTPDALINVLDSIHKVLQNRGKVITVVGAGGNRDTGKRPIMAKESALRSDKLILTSDNPRFEEPDAIIDDMIKGLSKEDLEKTIVITNRKEAIKTACMLAQKNDVILVAGKGHETYQDVKGTKHHFDDKEVINTIIQQ